MLKITLGCLFKINQAYDAAVYLYGIKYIIIIMIFLGCFAAISYIVLTVAQNGLEPSTDLCSFGLTMRINFI